jgi:hypothetical protein
MLTGQVLAKPFSSPTKFRLGDQTRQRQSWSFEKLDNWNILARRPGFTTKAAELFRKPNIHLRAERCAEKIHLDSSWSALQEPNNFALCTRKCRGSGPSICSKCPILDDEVHPPPIIVHGAECKSGEGLNTINTKTRKAAELTL